MLRRCFDSLHNRGLVVSGTNIPRVVRQSQHYYLIISASRSTSIPLCVLLWSTEYVFRRQLHILWFCLLLT